MKQKVVLLLFLLGITVVSGQTVFTVNNIDYIITGETTVTYSKYIEEDLPSSNYTIPSTVNYNSKLYTVTAIGSSALGNRLQLESINIPNTITSIGDGAFNNCQGLTSVIIPNSVTAIGNMAFNRCSVLNSITIPSSVTSIGSSAFSFTALTSVTIPNSVTSIGTDAFKACANLNSVAISNSLTSIERGTFWDCEKLTSVIIPNSITLIKDYAFYNCSTLTSIAIPNSVTSIGTYAFGNCSALSSLFIANSVTSIKGYAFTNCSNLTSIVCAIPSPLVITSSVFQGVNKAGCSLEVPSVSVNAYKAAAQWKDFYSITGNPTLHTDTFVNQKEAILYPNPFSNELFLELKNTDAGNLQILDINGKVILNKKVSSGLNQIDTSSLASEMYFIKLSSGSITSVKKLIKK